MTRLTVVAEQKFRGGDVVQPDPAAFPGKLSDTLMTVEGYERHVESRLVWCMWFDENEKVRRLRFWENDLILKGRSSGGNMGLK